MSHLCSPTVSSLALDRMYEDQEDVLRLDGSELPTDLGERIVRECGEREFDSIVGPPPPPRMPA